MNSLRRSCELRRLSRSRSPVTRRPETSHPCTDHSGDWSARHWSGLGSRVCRSCADRATGAHGGACRGCGRAWQLSGIRSCCAVQGVQGVLTTFHMPDHFRICHYTIYAYTFPIICSYFSRVSVNVHRVGTGVSAQATGQRPLGSYCSVSRQRSENIGREPNSPDTYTRAQAQRSRQ